MSEYHKIQSVYKRDPENKFRTFIEGDWSLPEFGYLAALEWEFTEKVDGTNIRVYWDGDSASFRGRTDRATTHPKLLDRLAAMFDRDAMADVLTGPMVLYGEGYGPKIQKAGAKYRDDMSFVLFDIKAGDVWQERDTVQQIGDALCVDVVPIIGRGSLHDMVEACRTGFDSEWGAFTAEGIVARPTVPLLDRMGRRIITKCKCRDFAS